MKYELECNEELVLIEPDEVTRELDDKIIMSDLEKKNLEKQQNRGKIVAVGTANKFWEVGDYVSFYKNAATPVKENGKEYQTIHKGHVLVRFKEIIE